MRKSMWTPKHTKKRNENIKQRCHTIQYWRQTNKNKIKTGGQRKIEKKMKINRKRLQHLHKIWGKKKRFKNEVLTKIRQTNIKNETHNLHFLSLHSLANALSACLLIRSCSFQFTLFPISSACRILSLIPWCSNAKNSVFKTIHNVIPSSKSGSLTICYAKRNNRTERKWK